MLPYFHRWTVSFLLFLKIHPRRGMMAQLVSVRASVQILWAHTESRVSVAHTSPAPSNSLAKHSFPEETSWRKCLMAEISYREPLPLFQGDLPISLEARVFHHPFPLGRRTNRWGGALHKISLRKWHHREKRGWGCGIVNTNLILCMGFALWQHLTAEDNILQKL